MLVFFRTDISRFFIFVSGSALGMHRRQRCSKHVLRSSMTNGMVAKMNFAARGGKAAIKMLLLKVIIGKKIYQLRTIILRVLS